MGLYDDIGGASAVTLAVSVFSHRVTADESLGQWFDSIDLERLVAHQRAFLTMALDGPDVFTGRTMAVAHGGLGITDEAYDLVIEHLAYALLDSGVTHEHVTEVIARLQPVRAQIVDASATA